MTKQLPYVTICLVFLNTIIYFFIGSKIDNYSALDINSLIDYGANFSGLTLGGQWWRLVTNCFLHGDLVHLFSNMITLLYLGSQIERKLPRFNFLIIYLILGFGASMISIWWHTFTPAVGASGAIAGLLGYYVIYSVLNYKSASNVLYHVLMLATIVLFSIILEFFMPYIDDAAHIGGFVFGSLASLVMHTVKTNELFEKYKKNRIGLILVVVSCGCLCLLIYISYPGYRADYYVQYKRLAANEQKALQIQNKKGSFSDNLYYAELNTAKDIWTSNLSIIDSMPYIYDPLIQQDLDTWKRYSKLRIKGIEYLRKTISDGSFMYIDKLHKVTYEIEMLPDFNYFLVFKESKDKQDNLIPSTVYFDRHWVEITSSDSSKYYRKTQVDSAGRVQGWAYDFYQNNMLQMKGQYTDNLQNGLFFYFFPNGNYKSMGYTSVNMNVGKWQNFYYNGQLESEVMYSDAGARILNQWDSLGTQLVRDGNGVAVSYNYEESALEIGAYLNGKKHSVWQGYYDNDSLYYQEEYVNGAFLQGISFSKSGVKYYYNDPYISATPYGGILAYQVYLHDNYKYPQEAIDNNVHGLMNIEVVLDSTGHIIACQPVNILGHGADEELIELIRKKPSFSPVIRRGMPVVGRTYVLFKP